MPDSLSTATDSTTYPSMPAAAALAGDACDAVRAINHLTLLEVDAFENASDVYDLLGHLRDLTRMLPQTLAQAARWLALAESQGRLSVDSESTPTGARRVVADAVALLTLAARAAAAAGDDLGDAHSAVARLATDAYRDRPVPYLPAGGAPPDADLPDAGWSA